MIVQVASILLWFELMQGPLIWVSKPSEDQKKCCGLRFDRRTSSGTQTVLLDWNQLGLFVCPPMKTGKGDFGPCKPCWVCWQKASGSSKDAFVLREPIHLERENPLSPCLGLCVRLRLQEYCLVRARIGYNRERAYISSKRLIQCLYKPLIKEFWILPPLPGYSICLKWFYCCFHGHFIFK